MGQVINKPAWHAPRWALRALLWSGLAAVHAPALIASWNACLHEGLNAARGGGCLALSATMVFFFLKLWNVEFLRFDTSPKSLVLIAVAVVLMHGNAIERGLGGAVVSKDAPIAATSTLMSLGLRRVQRAAVAAVSRAAERARQSIAALLHYSSSTTETLVPRRWILATQPCAPRAPPA
jgi:hypothetical protein